MMDYQVELDIFRGPLDLLLYLVKRQEVDITEIPIARVAEQFLDYLRVIELIDVERAGDFLVMAATLMEIKSRMLLPHMDDPAQQPLRQVELWDLVSAFGRLMRETLALQPQQIIVDQTPVHVYMESLLRRFDNESRLAFSVVFTPPYSRARLVGLFLAVLELIKGGQIAAEQPEVYGEIWLSRLAQSAQPAVSPQSQPTLSTTETEQP
jgi:segregation and condensation protein A